MKQAIRRIASATALACLSGFATAGPVIIGGDDLNDHGSRIAGVNQEGWLYIEKAIGNTLSGVTRAGFLTVDIVALGAAANPTFTQGNAGGAIGSAALNAGKTVLYVDGAAAITQFFADLASGLVNPGMLYFTGNQANGGLDAAEGAVLTTNAAAINNYGASGGGIMSHGAGGSATGWLTTLLPGLIETLSCSSSGATLTVAGQAAFPGLTNSDVDANAGPCHASFTGNFGGLTTLAFDGNQRSYIIGGGAGTVIQCGQPGQRECPTVVPEPGSLPLALLAAMGLAIPHLRRRIGAVKSNR